MAEALTINRAFAITLGIIGGIGSVSLVAGATILWSTREAVVAIKATTDANSASQVKQIDELKASIHELGVNRYSASDASNDRMQFFQTLRSDHETTYAQIAELVRAKDEQGQAITELRVQMAKGKP